MVVFEVLRKFFGSWSITESFSFKEFYVSFIITLKKNTECLTSYRPFKTWICLNFLLFYTKLQFARPVADQALSIFLQDINELT